MKKVFSVLVIIFFIGFGLGTSQSMPTNQLVFLDSRTNEYYAPPCIMSHGFDSKETMQAFAKEHNLSLLTEKERRKLPTKSHPNSECRDKAAFTEDGRSLTGWLLERIKILPKEETKWNDDGTWKSM